MPTDLPEVVRTRLRPGWMCKADTRPETCFLYDPVSDSGCRFVLQNPEPGELCLADLDSNDRAWEGGRLRVDIYHTAQSLRRHQDGQEANLEINYLCHYACRHCFQSLRPASHPDASPEAAMLRAAAERLLAAGATEISITGGDIFLQPAVWDLLDYLHEQAPRTTLRLLVNGGGLDLHEERVRGRLQSLAGRRVLVKSDFFGHTPELHDGFTRVPGSFVKLVGIIKCLKAAGIACLPTAALTRPNFDTRFELVNFLYNLTDDCFTVSTIIYPSDHRDPAALAELRLRPEQYAELMEEKFFVPLAAEYHTFEPQCAGNCQFAVVSATGPAWGCSFLKLPPMHANGTVLSLPLLDVVHSWREQASARAVFAECPTCPARSTCRKCPSFLSAGQTGDAYCSLSRLAHPWLVGRLRQALDDGFTFVQPEAFTRIRQVIEGAIQSRLAEQFTCVNCG